MSKKKNTLKDLDEFLKQQAASLVTPSPVVSRQEKDTPQSEPASNPIHLSPISFESVLQDLNVLAEQQGQSFRKKFYELIVQTLEKQTESLPEDKMLINTALYLQSGQKWKDVIREYWKANG